MRFQVMKMYFELKKCAIKENFDELYDEIKDKVAYATKGRRSCLFCLHKLDLLGDTYSNKFGYNEVPSIIERIRTNVELMTSQIYDYVLVHIYLDGFGPDKTVFNICVDFSPFFIFYNLFQL